MNTLDRYVGLSVAKGYLLVMLILLGLFSLLDFVEQVEDIGKGDYQLPEAFAFVLFMQPRRMLDLIPFIALLGSVFALGGLAGTSELTAMQAAGISTRRISWAVVKTGLVLMVAVAILDEFVVPPLQQLAHNHRTIAILGTGDLRTQEGFWSRDGYRFINVRRMRHGRIPHDIDIYQFDDRGKLRLVTHADRAETFDFTFKQWLLIDVRQRVINEDGIILRDVGSMRWESFLTPNQIEVLAVPQESLSISDLYFYVDYLKGTGQLADRYEMALWQKISLPLATGGMVLLSIPFVFGPLRSVTAGKRIALGAVTGLAFYLIKQIIENTGLVLGLSVPLTVMIPVIVILGFGIMFLRRLE